VARYSASAFFLNLRQPMPARRKAHLLARNQWIKLSGPAPCCGYPGEPGC
jgi:hypothetical protein